MEAPQLGARLYADRLDQRRARLSVGRERIGLPAAAIQREHALRVQPLAQRLGSDERFQLADHLPVDEQISDARSLNYTGALVAETTCRHTKPHPNGAPFGCGFVCQFDISMLAGTTRFTGTARA